MWILYTIVLSTEREDRDVLDHTRPRHPTSRTPKMIRGYYLSHHTRVSPRTSAKRRSRISPQEANQSRDSPYSHSAITPASAVHKPATLPLTSEQKPYYLEESAEKHNTLEPL